jgi:hypothetical protein
MYDSPTTSLYRMCEFLCADDQNALMLEMDYFWDGPHSLWRVEDIPDPRDHDERRHAVLASTVESLTLAFNFRHNLGLRREQSSSGDWQLEICPEWAIKAPPLQPPLVLDREEDDIFPRKSDAFTKRNIIANSGNLFNI